MENNFSKYLDKLVVVLLFAIILASCSNDEIPSPVFSDDNISVVDIEGKRTLAEAILLSSQSREKTRSSGVVDEVKYVVENGDTVAYIINYANGGGFSIIAADNAVKPLLAFSDKGHFSMENDIARVYFIGNIGKYAEQEKRKLYKTIQQSVTEDTIYYWQEPIIKISLWQGEPFNKVVDKHYPGCLAGCGPVSAAMIMSYCKSSLILNNYQYGFVAMKKALLAGPGYNPYVPGFITYSSKIPLTWINTYDGAVNAFSQLLYDMGSLMDSEYDLKTKKSTAELSKAAEAIGRAGYIVSDTIPYDAVRVIEDLKDNIIFQRGQCLENGEIVTGGHFWVIDGVKYGLTSSDQYVDIHFYCHWGWKDGESDGYFSSDVMKPFPNSKMAYMLTHYFTVKVENK